MKQCMHTVEFLHLNRGCTDLKMYIKNCFFKTVCKAIMFHNQLKESALHFYFSRVMPNKPIPKVMVLLSDMSSVTEPAIAVFRNEVVLKPLLESFSRPYQEPLVIVDAFACVGFDSLSFLSSFQFSSVCLHAVQIKDTRANHIRSVNLHANLDLFANYYRLQNSFQTHGTDISQFLIGNYHRLPNIHMIYLDPPWYHDKTGQKYKLQEYLEMLYDKVFAYLNLLHIASVCIKTDYDYTEDFQRIWEGMGLGNFVHYATVINQPNKKRFYFHVFVKTTVLPQTVVGRVFCRYLRN